MGCYQTLIAYISIGNCNLELIFGMRASPRILYKNMTSYPIISKKLFLWRHHFGTLFVLVLSRIIQSFVRTIVISDKVWRTSTLFASPLNWFLRNIALPITNKRLPGPASERGGYQRPSDRHQWLYRKLKISLAEKYLDSTEKRLHGKIFRIQKFLDSKVPSLDCGFKISGDMTKPGYFHFGFVLLCVNGKTKRY